VPLRIYNTQSRSKEEFLPQAPPQVKMYVCGITAYDYCHLGHARAAVVFDVINRYLTQSGYKVQYVRNFTDIDDKIIRRALEGKKDWKEVASTFIEAFQEDMVALGNLPPTHEPKATEFVELMQEMISTLVAKGIAYASGGDVFFSVRKFPQYGKLSQKNIEELEAGARVEVQESKSDPLDFALWKAAKPGEPEWDSPWGKGRPGWHIECSAMSTRLLGPSLDIHGGGRDLIFPHHENEIAQSEASYEQPFVRYWVHNGFVNLNADKMSKSTGNFLTIREVLSQFPHEAVRYFLLSAHYRSPLDFSEGNMKEALAALDRLYQTLQRLGEYRPGKKTGTFELPRLLGQLESFPEKAGEAMDDDFNTAQVLGLFFEGIRSINKFLDASPSAQDAQQVADHAGRCVEWTQQCLGLFGSPPAEYMERRKEFLLRSLGWQEGQVEQKLEERRGARQTKDFARADQIRDELASAGIALKDNPDGTTSWAVK